LTAFTGRALTIFRAGLALKVVGSFRERNPSRSSGELTAQVDYPRARTSNPMTDEEVSDRFRMLARRKLPKAQVEQALATMWALDTAKGLDPCSRPCRLGANTGQHEMIRLGRRNRCPGRPLPSH
jgi:hypothetical protein